MNRMNLTVGGEVPQQLASVRREVVKNARKSREQASKRWTNYIRKAEKVTT